MFRSPFDSEFLYTGEDCYVSRPVADGQRASRFVLGKGRGGKRIHRPVHVACFVGRPVKKRCEFLLGRPVTPGPLKESGVYVLEKPGGSYYVGKSANIRERLIQHSSGSGASCAKGFLRRVATLTAECSDHEAWERSETLARMRIYGISRVRGWMYTTPALTDAQVEHAFGQICERNDLCRRCGSEAHFAARCSCSGAGKRPEWAC